MKEEKKEYERSIKEAEELGISLWKDYYDFPMDCTVQDAIEYLTKKANSKYHSLSSRLLIDNNEITIVKTTESLKREIDAKRKSDSKKKMDKEKRKFLKAKETYEKLKKKYEEG